MLKILERLEKRSDGISFSLSKYMIYDIIISRKGEAYG